MKFNAKDLSAKVSNRMAEENEIALVQALEEAYLQGVEEGGSSNLSAVATGKLARKLKERIEDAAHESLPSSIETHVERECDSSEFRFRGYIDVELHDVELDTPSERTVTEWLMEALDEVRMEIERESLTQQQLKDGQGAQD